MSSWPLETMGTSSLELLLRSCAALISWTSVVPLHRPCLRTRWRGCRCSTSPLCATTSSVWKQTTGASPPRSRSTWPTTAPRSDPVSGLTRLFEATSAVPSLCNIERLGWRAVELFQRWAWTSSNPRRPQRRERMSSSWIFCEFVLWQDA